jgi:hypothetical protein
MSPLGHSRHFAGLPMTSGLSLEADVVTAGRHVSKVPETDLRIIATEHNRKRSEITLVRDRPDVNFEDEREQQLKSTVRPIRVHVFSFANSGTARRSWHFAVVPRVVGGGIL